MYRNLLSIIAGLICSFLLVLLFESTFPILFHIETLSSESDAATFKTYIQKLPNSLLALMAISYGVAAFVGCFVSIRLSGYAKTGMRAALLFFSVVLVNFLSFYHPLWMILLGLVATVGGGLLPVYLKKEIT